MRVLHCITGLEIGGAEMLLYRFLRQTRNCGIKAGVFTLMSHGPLARDIAALGVRVFEGGFPKGRPTLSGVRLVHRTVCSFRPDILHGWMYHGNLAASIGGWFGAPQAPVLWSIHHSLQRLDRETPATRLLVGGLARISKRVAAVSYSGAGCADDHEAMGFDPAGRNVIPNGVDPAEFHPLPDGSARLRAAFRIPASRLLVGNMARAHPMKNQTALVEAIAILVREGLDVHGVLVGEGVTRGAAIRRARTLGLSDRIAAMEPRSDIAAIVSGLDLFVLCSSWGETSSLATLEAMAAGVPVVVTDVGDSRILVGDQSLVVPPENPPALAVAMSRILSLPRFQRSLLGLRLRARVCQSYTIERYANQHLALYERIRHSS